MKVNTLYHPSAEQLALGSAVTESFDELLPLSRLHASNHEDSETWRRLEDIGVFSVGISEARGGSGLGVVEEALIVLGLGRRLASPGILATIGAAQVLSARGAESWRGKRAAAAYRRANRCVIVDDPEPTVVLLRDPVGASLHSLGPGRLAAIDTRLWLAGLSEITGLEAPLFQFSPSLVIRLRLLDAAALAGMAEAALDMAVAYAGIRTQFGAPIGSFQAVKHHCANMAISARCARDQTHFAAVALDEGRVDARLQAECAFLVAGTAALENAAKNIQIHGGMGFSGEADPHLFLKRAQLGIAIAGGLEAANERIAKIGVGS